MNINDTIHGFRLLKVETLEDINGTARTFEHIKTGAPLIYISNQDNNKVFHIAFKTPSDDSTGVAHILEHSVLCGSKKYPVKEPFVELAKGSLNTFLNAMTYPDKTVYPIASTNDKDFMNLMDVYLDAVFNPSIYDIKEIFMQEGWHYHLEHPDDSITYNGVVYNEMKGVYSSPEEILHYELFKNLYPDTIYSGESGGYPDKIPNLTYEGFLDFHKKYYHPSNAYIYLYGDGDVEAHLKYINDEYLCHYDYLEVDSMIPIQAPLNRMVEAKASYPVAVGEDLQLKDYLALGFVMERATSFEDLLAMDVLGHILLGHNTSPLKKALMDLKICKEVDYSFTTSMQQPYFSIILKNTDNKYRELFHSTVLSCLSHLVVDGIDPRTVEAGINSAEFSLKEGEFGTYPRGLMYGLEMMDTWLYGGDPLSNLRFNSAIERLRESSHHRGFEGLIERYLVKNTHSALVTIVPDDSLSEKNEKLLEKKLSDYKASLNKKAISDLVKETQQLLKHQNTEDSAEALATIPKLSLNEIDRSVRTVNLIEESYKGNTLLWHPGETNGIVYVKLFFDIHSVAQDDLKYLSLLNKFMGHLGTNKYSSEELNQEIEIETGGIATSIETFDHTKIRGAYSAKFVIKGKAVVGNVNQLMALIREITLETKFEDKKLMGDILGEVRMAKEQKFLTAGNGVSVQRLQSYYSQSARLFEAIGGIEFYQFLSEIDDSFDERYEELRAKVEEIATRLFNRKQVIISLTCREDDRLQAQAAIDTYMDALPDKAVSLYDYYFPLSIRNEGFKTAAKIQYVSKGYNIRNLGYRYDGSLLVLKSVLAMDYLWNKVRVQGGAYGASFGINKAGELFFSSFRDPNISKTFDTYDHAWEFINRLDLSDRELEKYIIGTISSKDTPLSDALIGSAANTMFFNGTTQEDLQRERDEILTTTNGDLRRAAEMVKAAMEKDILCVIGGEDMIEKDATFFNEVKNIK